MPTQFLLGKEVKSLSQLVEVKQKRADLEGRSLYVLLCIC